MVVLDKANLEIVWTYRFMKRSFQACQILKHYLMNEGMYEGICIVTGGEEEMEKCGRRRSFKTHNLKRKVCGGFR